MKYCKDCGIELNDKTQTPAGVKFAHARCSVHHRAYQNAWRKLNPRPDLRARTLAPYGITEEEYDAMLLDQEGVCAICKKAETGDSRKKFLAVDHDHKTGQVRGLLCHKCNRGLGHFDDDKKLLEAALDYLN